MELIQSFMCFEEFSGMCWWTCRLQLTERLSFPFKVSNIWSQSFRSWITSLVMKHNFVYLFWKWNPFLAHRPDSKWRNMSSSIRVESLDTLICVSSRFSEMFGCFYGLSPHNLHSLNTGQGWWCSHYWAPTPGLKVCHKAHGNNKYCKAQQRKTDYTSSKMIGTACWNHFWYFHFSCFWPAGLSEQNRDGDYMCMQLLKHRRQCMRG